MTLPGGFSDQARWEQEFAWAATAPTHQSHQMQARVVRPR
jgi:hypothetical protein